MSLVENMLDMLSVDECITCNVYFLSVLFLHLPALFSSVYLSHMQTSGSYVLKVLCASCPVLTCVPQLTGQHKCHLQS